MDDVPYHDAEQGIRDMIVAVFRLNGTIIETGNRLVRDLGLTSALWQLLDALDREGGPLPVPNIARHMGLARQSVQRGVDILAERGFVAFADNPHHRRARLVVLTVAGSDVLALANARQQPLAHRLAEEIGSNRISQAVETISQMTTLIEQSAVAPTEEDE